MSLTTPDLLECADEEERMSDIGGYLYVRWVPTGQEGRVMELRDGGIISVFGEDGYQTDAMGNTLRCWWEPESDSSTGDK